jgi:GR25 family glycosyltransferase involved in LPS biosynthesis
MYLIFEDDVEINSNTIEIITQIEPYIKEYNIDYLNLNCVNVGCSIQKEEFTIGNYSFGKPMTPFQTNSYIITKLGAQKILKYFDKTFYHVDFEILYTKLFKNLNYYTVNPPLLNLTNEETTIGISRKSLLFKIFELLNLNYIAWFLNVPIVTINLFYEINLLIIILLILLLLNKFYFNSIILLWFIIYEFFLLNIQYL